MIFLSLVSSCCRVQPGECCHLYTAFHEAQFADYQLPEMLRTRLEELCLQIKVPLSAYHQYSVLTLTHLHLSQVLLAYLLNALSDC